MKGETSVIRTILLLGSIRVGKKQSGTEDVMGPLFFKWALNFVEGISGAGFLDIYVCNFSELDLEIRKIHRSFFLISV